MVEGLFDVDGTDFEGRADLGMNLYVEFRTSLSEVELKRRITKAWSVFRQKHVMLASRAINLQDVDDKTESDKHRVFIYQPSADLEEVFSIGSRHATFVGEQHPHVDAKDFYQHLLNSARLIDASEALSRLFVLPWPHQTDNVVKLHFICIAAHQITDGLTSFNWMNSFVDILNMSESQLDSEAQALCTIDPTQRLPPAQETLYPPIHRSIARQRWFWAISRILRHKRRTPPAAFPNPMRSRPSNNALSLPIEPSYNTVLDYTKQPPLRSSVLHFKLSQRPTQRLAHLCRTAGISIGSGLFTLVAITMMHFHECLHPSIPLPERLPFVGSFPLNPRPFLTGAPIAGKEDSLMLAFSDGITLPFLPGDLAFEGRFRVLGRLAHRQLGKFTKRKRSISEEVELGAKGPGQLLAGMYIMTADRLEARRKAADKQGWDVMGAYPAATAPTGATCGISSVGDRSRLIRGGRYDVSRLGGRDLVVDFRDVQSGVRSREGEWLCGVGGDKDELGFMVSYDASGVDPDLVREWERYIQTVLEPPEGSEAKL